MGCPLLAPPSRQAEEVRKEWKQSFVSSRAQEELDAHFHERPFCRSDQKDLHYFRALIDEVQRIANVLPWNVPHSTSQEVVD